MTTRQYVLEIMDDAPNREELLERLIDLVESEKDRQYTLGQKAGRIGSQHDNLIKRLTSV